MQKNITPLQMLHWYMLSSDEVVAGLETSLENGLSEVCVISRQKKEGKNILPAKKPPSIIAIYFRQFSNPLIYILIGAAIIAVLMGHTDDALFILLVILLNAVLGMFQEWKAEKGAFLLQNLIKISVKAKRNGKKEIINAEELVPGDVVFMESGDRVPADIRLIKTNNLTIDEAILTGESNPVAKQYEPIKESDLPVEEQINMAFAGTVLLSGRATGVVVKIGMQTVMGKIAKTVSETAMAKTPLVLRMETFSRQLGMVFILTCSILGSIAFLQGHLWLDVVMMAIALAVSAIPEGLPIAITVALSIGSQRMAKRNVIVRNLSAVEGLGSCTAIASDKTGTLTLNRQTVKLLVLPDGKSFKVTGEGYAGEGEILTPEGFLPYENDMAVLKQLSKTAVLCNEGTLFKEDNIWHYHGDPVDIALLALGYKAGTNPKQLHSMFKLAGEIPYESEKRYAARFYHYDSEIMITVKGAVETILPYCKDMLTSYGSIPIDRHNIEKQSNELAEQGFRVIAIAEGKAQELFEISDFKEKNLASLTLLGLVGLIDPLRPEAKASIDACKQAGIKVVMVTGDHPATALTIAKELGIAESDKDLVVGAELAKLGEPDNPDFLKKINETSIFTRVNPVQKLHIVEAFKNLGHFVAVTGDGVNDTPALRTANIGIAMGSGSDIAKETAKIIVADDNFSSIEAGVEEGRYAYENVRKVIFLVLSTSIAEMILVTLSIIAGLPLPLWAVQLLWLNLVTDGIQVISLAFEKGEKDVLKHPPRKPEEGLFDSVMIKENSVAGLTMGLIAFAMWHYLLQSGCTEASARNMLLLLMVLLENFHTFNCRSERQSAFRIPLKNNWLLVISVIAAQGLHIWSMHIPFMQKLLKVEPIAFNEWVQLLVLASLLLIVMEIFKFFRRKLCI